jgi:hypothetical protein
MVTSKASLTQSNTTLRTTAELSILQLPSYLNLSYNAQLSYIKVYTKSDKRRDLMRVFILKYTLSYIYLVT